MASNDDILSAIPSTEPCSFSEFLAGLPDVPEKGDRDAWRDLFSQLKTLENAGLVEVERASRGGSIESLLLTGDGAERVRRARR
jgi:predicted transcriptional regulator